MRRFLERMGLVASPHPLLLKNREYFAAFEQNRPLTDYRFVVLDTELTGLGRRDEIISIGAVRESSPSGISGSPWSSVTRGDSGNSPRSQ